MNDKIQSPKLKDKNIVGNRVSNKQISVEKKYDLEERTAVFGETIASSYGLKPRN